MACVGGRMADHLRLAPLLLRCRQRVEECGRSWYVEMRWVKSEGERRGLGEVGHRAFRKHAVTG
jgi:hypothetical protein